MFLPRTREKNELIDKNNIQVIRKKRRMIQEIQISWQENQNFNNFHGTNSGAKERIDNCEKYQFQKN